MRRSKPRLSWRPDNAKKDREHNGEAKSVQWLPSCLREAPANFAIIATIAYNRYLDDSDTFEFVVRAVMWWIGEPRFLQDRDDVPPVIAAIDLTTFHWGRIFQQLRTRRHFRQQCWAMRRIMSCTLASRSLRQRSPQSSRLSLSPIVSSYLFHTLFICFIYSRARYSHKVSISWEIMKNLEFL